MISWVEQCNSSGFKCRSDANFQIDKRQATLTFRQRPFSARAQLGPATAMADDKKPQGAGVISTELGTKKVDTYVQKLYTKAPQDTSFTRKDRETISSAVAVNGKSPLQFNVPGKMSRTIMGRK